LPNEKKKKRFEVIIEEPNLAKMRNKAGRRARKEEVEQSTHGSRKPKNQKFCQLP
jgi:hypothetical protein